MFDEMCWKKKSGFSELLANAITCYKVKVKNRKIFAFIKGELARSWPTLTNRLCIWLTLSFLSVLRWSLQAFLAEWSYHHHCYRSPSLLRPCGWRVLQAEVWCWILADPPDPRGYGYHSNRRHRDAPWNKEKESKVFNYRCNSDDIILGSGSESGKSSHPTSFCQVMIFHWGGKRCTNWLAFMAIEKRRTWFMILIMSKF